MVWPPPRLPASPRQFLPDKTASSSQAENFSILRGRERQHLLICKIDAVGKDTHDEIREGHGEIRPLATQTIEMVPRQGEKCNRTVRRYGRRPARTSEEAHLADDRMRDDTPDAQGSAVAGGHLDGDATRGEEVNAVRRLALVIQDLRGIDVLALEVSNEVVGGDGWAKLPLEPWLEAWESGMEIKVRLGQQLVFAPRERRIEIREDTIGPLTAEHAAEFERP